MRHTAHEESKSLVALCPLACFWTLLWQPDLYIRYCKTLLEVGEGAGESLSSRLAGAKQEDLVSKNKNRWVGSVVSSLNDQIALDGHHDGLSSSWCQHHCLAVREGRAISMCSVSRYTHFD